MALDFSNMFGWAGPKAAREAWELLGDQFPEFLLAGTSEVKRTVAWDSWSAIRWDVNGSVLETQETGDCVSFGGAIATACVAIDEIVRLGQPESFRVPFPPYLYGISRLQPEGGNGRLRGPGSLGVWLANTIVKYGVLPADYEGVPAYSGVVADRWGNSKSAWDEFVDFSDDHPMRSAAPITSSSQAIDAACNNYWMTIASMKGYSMRLSDRDGKSWYVGRDNWPHQMCLIGFDLEPEPCFYRRNSWGRSAHGTQLDGPDGGGWITADELDSELRSRDTECFAFSMFDGYPANDLKPRNYFG